MATFYLDFENGNDASAGTSWATAWKTINSGATAARIAPGDTIRVAKTADPTSIGNATWTSKSVTVTLATAQTTNIYMDGAWTLANSATVAASTTSFKQGSNSSQVTTPASTATATKYAYYATGTLDLSAYDAITLWFRNNTTAVADANRYVIKLCSDTAGDTAVDEFAIPSIASTTRWVPLTLTRTGGGSLGASIKSIALYTGSSSPGNSQVVLIDDVLACSSSGLSLTSLISKSSAGYSSTETWHGLQSIDGTTVILGNTNLLNAGDSSLTGYYTTGTSPETVTTYIRPTYKLAIQSNTTNSANTVQDSGTAGNLITFSGGWNTSSDTQDGVTILDGQNGIGVGITASIKNYIKIERFGFCRLLNVFYTSALTSTNWEIESCFASNISSLSSIYQAKYTNIIVNNTGSGVNVDNSVFENVKFYSTSLSATINITLSKIKSIYFYNCASTSATFGNSAVDYLEVVDSAIKLSTSTNTLYIGEAVLKNNTGSLFDTNSVFVINKLTSSGNATTTSDQAYVTVKQTASSPQLIGLPGTTTPAGYQTPSTMYSLIGGDANDHRSYWAFGNAISQTTTRHTASGIAWQINITSSSQTTNLPARYPIAKVAVNASSLVTVKAWVKLSHATNIGAQLLVQANEIPGVTADVTATKTADTNWEELTITFTPTVQGVVQVYLAAYWRASTANQSVYVDDITVTQA